MRRAAPETPSYLSASSIQGGCAVSEQKSGSEFYERFGKILAAGVRLKKVMQEKKLIRAKTFCPMCNRLKLESGGYLYGELVGPKKHLHMACTKCDARMME
jgi:hypothetical protein